jgi:hypothetical protein
MPVLKTSCFSTHFAAMHTTLLFYFVYCQTILLRAGSYCTITVRNFLPHLFPFHKHPQMACNAHLLLGLDMVNDGQSLNVHHAVVYSTVVVQIN